MIEQIMYFLLGVLLATLVALLVLPAVWHRAVRLTTRRVEAAVPVSLFEVQADKDQQRAFFALNQRRLELQTEELRAALVDHAATIEAQRQRILELEGQVATLTQGGETASAHAAEQQVLVGELQDQVSDLKARGAALEAELAQARAALASLEGAHGALTKTRQGLEESLASREAGLAEQSARATALDAEIALLSANLTATAQRLDGTTDLLEKAQANAARLEGELTETRAQLAARSEESAARAEALERLGAERDTLATDLANAQADLDASRAVLHAFEQRRASEFADAQAETRRITSSLHMLSADHALMAGALEKARAGTPGEADLQPVKTALADVAARIVALTARLEGPASPVPGLVATGADETATGSDGSGPSLAARIRALLDAAPAAGTAPESAPSDERTAEAAAIATPAPVSATPAPAIGGTNGSAAEEPHAPAQDEPNAEVPSGESERSEREPAEARNA